MRKMDYKTTRNWETNEFYKKPKPNYLEENIKTIERMFPSKSIKRLNTWERTFIKSLKGSVYVWTEKQVAVLKKIKLKYENHSTKN
jgi:hypothetical protein